MATPRRSFPHQPVEETFLDTAPLRLAETFEIPRPAAEVWGDLTADNPLSWCRLLRSINWTSPRPFGVGTTRTARTIGNATVINERFFRWEEGRRKSFYVLDSNLPFFRRFAEDYLVEPTSATACRFTWAIAVEPHPLALPANPATRRLLSTLLRDTRAHYRVR
jgi:Polyketide cyclase / dehydrase and lipid transport